MTIKITTLEIRQSLGDVLNRVNLREDQYIIQRKGKSLAAIVPVWQLEKWQNDKKEMFKIIESVQEKNKKTGISTIEKEVSEAVANSRKQRK